MRTFKRQIGAVFLTRGLQFGAGPAPLPTPVLERGAAVRTNRFHQSLIRSSVEALNFLCEFYFCKILPRQDEVLGIYNTNLERLS